MGDVYEHREELSTLKEQGEEEKKKAEELVKEHANFQNILSAISGGNLQKGMKDSEVAKKFGRAGVDSRTDSGYEWLYIEPNGKRLKNPRIQLNFDKNKHLTDWECFYVECGSY